MKVAVIGAGLAGAVLARDLTEKGVDISVFEKSRGIGGRMTTRRGDGVEFDHGAQFFTVRSPLFQTYLQPYLAAGILADWKPKITTLSPDAKAYKRFWYEPHLVATPRMNELCKRILAGIGVKTDCHVQSLSRQNGEWRMLLADGSKSEAFDWVVSTAPAEQTRNLFGGPAEILDLVQFSSCFALLAETEDVLPWQVAVVKDSPIHWLAFSNSKPGRQSAPALTAHATPSWTAAHYEDDLISVADNLLEAITNVADINIVSHQIHRWRYARTMKPLGEPFWMSSENGLAACGDWCLGDRVEDAFLSASALATQMQQCFEDRIAGQARS